MKRTHLTSSIAALLAAAAISPLAAQEVVSRPGPSESGIYRTADAYLAGQIELAVDTRTTTHVIDRHTVLNKPYVDVQHAGKNIRYTKSDIFGFRDGEGRDVRFVGNREFTIVEAGPLYLYTSERVVPEGKRMKAVTDYSFSRTVSSEVLPLTKANVKRALPEAHGFHHLLDMTFPDDASLSAFDTAVKTFKVNALYRQSK